MINSKSVKTILFSIFSILIFVTLFCLFLNITKSVTIIVDGIEVTTQTRGETVMDVLKENNIVLQDNSNVFPYKSFKINDGDVIVLENPVPVVLYSGGMDPYEVMTSSDTVGDFLEEQGIEIEENDIVNPAIDTKIVPDLEVEIKYIDTVLEDEQIDIDYKTIVKYTDDLYEGNQRVVQEGEKGLKLIKREKYYENGVEIKNNVIYSNIEIQPIDKIIEKGIKKREAYYVDIKNSLYAVRDAYLGGSKISFLGDEYLISDTMVVEATAFYNSGSNGNHTTATGNPTFYNPNGWSTIAVDPKIIPLNTKVYIEGYGFGIAHDTGGAIKGKKIDVFMPSRDSAYTWGRKKGVKIYILK